MQCLLRSWGLPNDSKHNELSKFFNGYVVIMSCSDAWMSRSGDFVLHGKT